MHRWFRQTTEQGMINRRTNIMKPDLVKHDYQLAGAIERWEERYRTLVEEEGEEELPEKFRMAALRGMLTGDIKSMWIWKTPKSKHTMNYVLRS